MEEWIRKILESEKKKREKPLEVKRVKDNYYLYVSTTRWDKKEKKRKKVSRYIGKITRNGITESNTNKNNIRSIFEYGNAKLLYNLLHELINPLKENFPNHYREIIAMSIIKVINQTPLRLMKTRWEKLYLLNEINASLSPNTVSQKIKEIGSDLNAQKVFFDYLLSKSRYLIFDLSSIVSHSENLRYAEKGYNSEHHYLNQINFALIFSFDKNIPVMIKVLPGSVRDIKSFKYILKDINLKDSTLVLDRGFASYYMPDLLNEKSIKYILPLRRNFEIIDYEINMESCFTYNGRGIYWGRKNINNHFLYLFEDVKLRAEEETVFIEMLNKGLKKYESLSIEKKKFGRVAIISNIFDDGKNIYNTYKEREEVEIAFDSLKNELENDKTYLSDDDSVRGYFFISLISLYLYFKVLNLIREKGYTGKISVNELLFELSKIYLIYYNDNRNRLSIITKRVEKLDKLFNLNLFPKELMS